MSLLNHVSSKPIQEGDFERLLQIEEESIKEMVQNILKHKPDLVVTEKGLDDRAQHFFVKVLEQKKKKKRGIRFFNFSLQGWCDCVAPFAQD